MILTAALAAGPAEAACSLAQVPPVPVIKGFAYDQARRAVLASGWLPARGTGYDDLSSNETVFRERGYREVMFCAVDRDATCRFDFTSANGATLRVFTTGQENILLGTRALVKTIEESCP